VPIFAPSKFNFAVCYSRIYVHEFEIQFHSLSSLSRISAESSEIRLRTAAILVAAEAEIERGYTPLSRNKLT